MKVFLGSLLFVCFTFAQALTLDEALATVEAQETIVAAQLELSEAQEAYARAQADPLGLKLERVEARQRLTLAEATLEHARAVATAEITTAYNTVLIARTRSEVAQTAVDMNARLLEGVQIRFRNGSATELDVQEAQTTLEEANTNLRAAGERLELAVDALQSLIGQEVIPSSLELVPESYFTELPSLDEVVTAMERHPDLLKARQERELAELTFKSLDPVYAAPAEISQAQTAFETSQATEQRTERTFRVNSQDLLGQATTTKEASLVRETARTNAESRLAYEQSRLDAGLLSEVEFLTARLTASEASLAALEAKLAYLETLLALRTGTAREGRIPNAE